MPDSAWSHQTSVVKLTLEALQTRFSASQLLNLLQMRWFTEGLQELGQCLLLRGDRPIIHRVIKMTRTFTWPPLSTNGSDLHKCCKIIVCKSLTPAAFPKRSDSPLPTTTKMQRVVFSAIPTKALRRRRWFSSLSQYSSAECRNNSMRRERHRL